MYDKRTGRKWAAFRKQFLARFPICCVCGKLADTVDHITSIQLQADTYRDEDYLPMCRSCNSRKGATYDKECIRASREA
jgi:5-methylcytosine-specific restriction endonuclease McrA